MDHLLAARLQMAFTLGFHIVLACLGVGMPLLMLFAEWRYLRTGEQLWQVLARRWSQAFAVFFAVGAVSGTVLSFELGILWPEFMQRFGAVVGLPFTLEGFAFFLEAIFAGIYLYGWDRLSPRMHWFTGWPIALSGCASAWFVVTANAWMNCPSGFEMAEGVVTRADPIAAMLNPATGAQTSHMIVAAYLVTGFVLAAFYAAAVLRGVNVAYSRRAMGLALGMGTVFAICQLPVGHWSARVVADTQPVKLASMEGQFATQRAAPLRIGGWPDRESRETRFAIEIPGGLSWLAYGDSHAEVEGLNDFPQDQLPPVAIVHVAFQLMTGIGMLLACVALWVGGSLLWRRRLPDSRGFLWLLVLCGPLTVVAMECGWIVTEVGRQPWIVQGVMRTSDAVTSAPGTGWVLSVTLSVYAVLSIGMIIVLRMLALKPLPRETQHGT